VPRDPVARAAAEARATEAVRVFGRMALEMTQEWIAAEQEYIAATRAALQAEMARQSGADLDANGNPIIEGELLDDDEDAP
jgi:hypothetical protein